MPIITSLTVENFAVFQTPLQWENHASLNVIIGENDTGKTHLLKLLCALARTIEEYWKKQSGPQPVPLAELLANKMLWPFLPPKEILSIFDAVIATREGAEIAAFDDTSSCLPICCMNLHRLGYKSI